MHWARRGFVQIQDFDTKIKALRGPERGLGLWSNTVAVRGFNCFFIVFAGRGGALKPNAGNRGCKPKIDHLRGLVTLLMVRRHPWCFKSMSRRTPLEHAVAERQGGSTTPRGNPGGAPQPTTPTRHPKDWEPSFRGGQSTPGARDKS